MPALTGLRLFAASFVLVGHLILTVVPPKIGYETFLRYLAALPGLGMTLFFVLSGFVIHYNYAAPVSRGGWRGTADFFVARFARLYPLFLGTLVLSLLFSGIVERAARGDQIALANLTQVLPYYLSLTFTWLYQPHFGSSLVYQYPSSSLAIAWSISTEWFFYLLYPLLCRPLCRIRRASTAIVCLAGCAVVALAVLRGVYRARGQIDDFALAAFGDIAVSAPDATHSLFRWIVYFSPELRLFEFIVGCLVASLYLATRDRPLSLDRFGAPLTALTVAALALQQWVMFRVPEPFPFLTFLHMNFGFAPLVAVLIFCVARYKSPIARLLSRPWLLLAGEASYSLYLLHPLIVQRLNIPIPRHDGFWFWLFLGITAALAFIACIGLSITSFTLFEAPARRWLRRHLTIGAARKPGSAAVWPGALAVLMLLLFGSGLGARALATRPSGISVVEATYGKSCDARINNALPLIGDACAGRGRCRFLVDVAVLGDPKSGCIKDFSITWQCRDGAPQTAYIPGEAGLGTPVEIACAAAP